MLFPSKMQVAKIIIPKKYTRNVTKALQDLECIEFIDIEHKALARGPEHANREDIYDLLSRVTSIVNVLDLDKEKVPKNKIQVDETEIENVISFTRDLIEKTDAVISLQEEKAELEKRLQEKKEQSEKILELNKHFGIEDTYLGIIGEGPYFTAIIGSTETKSLPEIEWKLSEVTDNTCFIDSSEVEKGESLLLIASLNKHLEVIRRVLRDYGFSELDVSDVIDSLSEDKQELEKRLNDCKSQISEITKIYGLNLLAARELLMIEKKNIDVTTNFRELSQDVTILWGWVPKQKLKEIRKTLDECTNKKCVVEITEPKVEEEEIPSNIPHRSIFAPAIDLVSSYGIPTYSELDPTLFMFFTFPLIFGMMFADVGHGAVLAILAAVGIIAKRRKMEVNEFVNYFLRGAELIFLCGVSSIFWGFVFGSVFGDHFGSNAHPAHPSTPIGEFLQGINSIFWFSPMEGNEAVKIFSFYLPPIMTLLIISFIVAAIHITMGLVLKFVRFTKEGNVLEAITVPLMLLWIYWGALYLVYQSMPRNEEGLITRFSIDITALLNNPIQLVTTVGVPLIIMAIGLFAKHGGEGAMEGLEYILALLSNTISYGRIVALNAVHAILSVLILEPFVGVGFMLWIAGIVLNTILVGLLEGILAFIHTLRLHWVEWFSKFYSGTGKEFKPFESERKFTQSPSFSI
ncbi:MAG: V-type ATP synthase subunit I [Promethearchaeota archaeon]